MAKENLPSIKRLGSATITVMVGLVVLIMLTGCGTTQEYHLRTPEGQCIFVKEQLWGAIETFPAEEGMCR